MSILASELVWRKPENSSNTPSNGGRMTSTSIPTSVKNNILPDVSNSDRIAGITEFRKIFIHVANVDDLPLTNPKIFVDKPTPGTDNVTIFQGTTTDTEATIGTPILFGCGYLDTAATAGDLVVSVRTEDFNLNYLQAGMPVRISDKPSVDAAGNEEYFTISSISVYAGDIVSLTLSAALANSYATTDTYISSVIEPGTIQATVTPVIATVTGATPGTYDDTTFPLLLNSIGGIEQNWTITFSDATNYILTSDDPALALSVAGTISGNLVPVNADYTKPYFTLDWNGFGGIFVAGDTLTFTTTPAAVALWYRRDVPAGAASLAGDSVVVAVDGESS